MYETRKRQIFSERDYLSICSFLRITSLLVRSPSFRLVFFYSFCHNFPLPFQKVSRDFKSGLTKSRNISNSVPALFFPGLFFISRSSRLCCWVLFGFLRDILGCFLGRKQSVKFISLPTIAKAALQPLYWLFSLGF